MENATKLTRKKENEEQVAYLRLLGERFKQFRLDRELIQKDVAKKIDGTQNMIWRIEAGDSANAMMTLFYYYFMNHKLNPAWLFTPDNTGIDMYRTTGAERSSQRDFQLRKKSQLLDQLIAGLNEAGIDVSTLGGSGAKKAEKPVTD